MKENQKIARIDKGICSIFLFKTTCTIFIVHKHEHFTADVPTLTSDTAHMKNNTVHITLIDYRPKATIGCRRITCSPCIRNVW